MSTSGYYAWLVRPDAARIVEDCRLTGLIEDIHAESRGTYGVPRVHAELAARGERVGRKRVARLMRHAGLEGVTRRRKHVTTRRSGADGAAPDLLERDFTASGPDQKWVADITYVTTWAGFAYLAVVLDVWSRRIVGWAVADTLHTQVVLDALDMAIWRRRPTEVIHHSDKGCQYTSIAFGQRCKGAGVRPSTGTGAERVEQLGHGRLRQGHRLVLLMVCTWRYTPRITPMAPLRGGPVRRPQTPPPHGTLLENTQQSAA